MNYIINYEMNYKKFSLAKKYKFEPTFIDHNSNIKYT